MIRKTIIVVLTLGAVGTGIWMGTHPPLAGIGSTGARLCSWSSESRWLSLYYIATSGLYGGRTRRFHILYCWRVEDTSMERLVRWPSGVLEYAVGYGVCAPPSFRGSPPARSGTQYTPAMFAAVHFYLPLQAWLILFATYPTIAFIRGPVRRWHRRKRGRCVRCGYNLTGLTEPRCPECGDQVDDGAMEVVHPSVRDAFRRQQIRSIKRQIRRKYAERIGAASTKAERKRLKAERDAESAARTGPLVREGHPFYPPGHCQNCGYDLTGNMSGVCPECGSKVDSP